MQCVLIKKKLLSLISVTESMEMADLVTVRHARVPITRPTMPLGRPHSQSMIDSLRSAEIVA